MWFRCGAIAANQFRSDSQPEGKSAGCILGPGQGLPLQQLGGIGPTFLSVKEGSSHEALFYNRTTCPRAHAQLRRYRLEDYCALSVASRYRPP